MARARRDLPLSSNDQYRCQARNGNCDACVTQLRNRPGKDEVEQVLEGHALAPAEPVGRYERERVFHKTGRSFHCSAVEHSAAVSDSSREFPHAIDRALQSP
jgi:hypothetical protein